MSFYGARTAASPAGGAVNNQMSYYNKASATNLPNGPRDTISQLGWSNEGSLLSCTSWDNTVRVWQISAGFGSQIQAAAKVCMDAQAPLLCSTFGPSPNHLFVGCCDKTVKLYDLNASSSTPQVVAQTSLAAFSVFSSSPRRCAPHSLFEHLARSSGRCPEVLSPHRLFPVLSTNAPISMPL
ncbi:mRNA export protein [Toxoplasma gondii VAND]|uniref:mRNA export protein n=1 Tax=Toxoplasma gondii VAND TaxID=933077 RepID=A0A086QGQ2_TOXGO|nr:mRNA export protein [Toxoplasma gondii VAND]